MNSKTLAAIVFIAVVSMVQIFKRHASEEIQANNEGGAECHRKFADIQARKQKVVDDYNQADKEARLWQAR